MAASGEFCWFASGSMSSQWWSPLEPADVGEALAALGARSLDSGGSRTRFALSLGQEAFAPTLVLEPLPAARGSVVRVRTLALGFPRDFSVVVQLGLTGFVALMACYAALDLAGGARDSVLLALGIAWFTATGAFAMLRALSNVLVGARASAEACRRARVALFAQLAELTRAR